MADVPGDSLKTVPLNDRHVALGGRMVPFSGYSLPVQYPTGILTEHKWTREHAGLFDVSHMGRAFLTLEAPTGDPERDHKEAQALDEPAITAIARIGHNYIKKWAILGAAACKSNNNHSFYFIVSKCQRAQILRYFTVLWQATLAMQ